MNRVRSIKYCTRAGIRAPPSGGHFNFWGGGGGGGGGGGKNHVVCVCVCVYSWGGVQSVITCSC